MITPIPSSDSKFYWVFFIHSSFMNALCSGWRNRVGMLNCFPNYETLYFESPDNMCTYFFLPINIYITFFAYGLRFE